MGASTPATGGESSSASPQRALLAGSLLTVAVGVLAAGLAGSGIAAAVARAALLVFVAAVLARPTPRDVLLIAAAAAVAAAMILRAPEPWAVLGRALDLGAFLAAFLLTLGMLREAALTSPLVRACGAVLTGQPPGRRYLALTLGGHVIGIVLSFGVLPLLGAMIRGGNTLEAAGGDARVLAIREQRMMTALLRGFALVPLWAPTSVNQALLLTLIPGLRWGELAAVGLAVAVPLMAFGWLYDRLRWRAARRLAASLAGATTDHPGPRPVIGMLLLVGAVLGLVFVVDALIARSLILAAMVTAPGFAVGWIAVQNRGDVPATLARLRRIVAEGLPAGRGEILVLGCAGFVGAGLAALIPPAAVPELAAGLGLPPFAVVAALLLVVPLAAQAAINPIVCVTLFGAAIQQGLLPGVDSRLPAVALAAGWSLALLTSPFSAAVLITAGLTGLPVRRVAYGWNGGYVLAAGLFTLALFVPLWLWLG